MIYIEQVAIYCAIGSTASGGSSAIPAPITRRGIVIAAGGSYLEPAFVSLYILRQQRQTLSQSASAEVAADILPVEIWSSRLIDGIMAPGIRKKLESLSQVTVHYIEDILGEESVTRLLLQDPGLSWAAGLQHKAAMHMYSRGDGDGRTANCNLNANLFLEFSVENAER